jgi:hypothetical protein
MKRADAALIKRYAAVRKLLPHVLKRRWADLSALTRATLRREMAEVIARHDAEQIRKRADAAFDSTTRTH